jgi:hypothetical protein
VAFTASGLAAYLKKKFDQKLVDNSMTSVSDAMLKSVGKKTDGSGTTFSWLVDADDSYNASPDFTTAQNAATNNTNTVGLQFTSSWNDMSAVAQVTSSVIGKTRNDDGAWMKAVDVAMKKTLAGIAHYNQLILLGYGWGEVSQISSISGATFVPKVPSDITKYVLGMPLVFSASLAGNTLDSATVLYVTGVSYTPGSELVTLNANLSTVSANANDWAFIAGARQNSATPAQIVPVGLNTWVPNQLADLGNSWITTVLGGNRTVNSRYYGTFVDGTQGGSPLGALMDGTQEACTIGNAKKLECFCSKATFTTIAKDLQNAVRYNDNPTSKSVGSTRLLVYADGQAEAHLNVSRTMNDNYIIGFDPETLVYRSIGGLPHLDNEDGLTMARQASTAGYEIRWFQQSIVQPTNLPSMLRVQLV